MSAAEPPETVAAAVRRLAARFAAAGIDTPRLDAELLVAHVIGGDRARLFLSPERPLDGDQAAALAELERRRAEDREPVAHLLGTRGFRYLELDVDRRVLVPRPETELLVEVGLELPAGTAVVDVGTGSGAIALALADERPDLLIHATDRSPEALAVARANRDRLGLEVRFHEGDLLADAVAAIGPGARPLAVLSNPPYVPDGDRPGLAPEVREHDPALALFGGPDGLDVIRRLLPAAADAGAALAAVELGAGQAPAVAALARAAGFAETEIRDDLAGIGRVVVARAAAGEGTPPADPGRLPLGRAAIERLTAVTGAGGVACFPAETVYGLAVDPDDGDAVRRMAALKRRDPGKPNAVMFWSVEAALEALGPLPGALAEAIAALLPGPLGLLVPNPRRRFAAVTGEDPESLGIRVPDLAEPVDAPPIAQTSANHAGGPDPATLDAVPDDVLDGCRLVVDRGPRPGTASTIVDLRGDGWRIVREGVVPTATVAARLAGRIGPERRG
ncbi:peptide chain release factor N(5)-glutamine methyltransferase [Patulibacter defluvii]|uniref:peptide chain release factor N(5)-glutamine methyltransferase n=1 Tax=Patulibacter defluvii TaxID=3095358 RepID=UPI002A754455|nr:peptide chain release factor N(5)-glutamine methyltransferase [Patulibacter sp. DM4]